VFYRYFATTRYPAIYLRYIAGVGNIGNNYFNYHNLQLNFTQRLFSAIGFTNYWRMKARKVRGATSCLSG